MKKYMITVVLLLFTVIAIGTYYVQAAQAKLPEFKLTTVQGDDSLVHDIDLYANYTDKDTSFGVTSAWVTTEGTTYIDYDNLLSALKRRPVSPQLALWIQDHRQFMRGKTWLRNFYENESMLTYVNTTVNREIGNPAEKKIAKLRVSTLDKKTNTTSEISSELEVGYDVTDMYVENVQYIDNQFAVLVIANHTSKQYIGEALLIRVNPATKAVTHEIMSLGSDAPSVGDHNSYTNYTLGFVNQALTHTDYWIIRTNGQKETKNYQAMYKVDIKSGQATPISFQGYEQLLYNHNLYMYEGKLYFLQRIGKKEKGFTITSYNIASNKFARVFENTTIDLSENITCDVKQNHLYVLGYNNHIGDHLYVYDLTNGKLEYEGKVEAVNSANAKEEESRINPNYIYIGNF